MSLIKSAAVVGGNTLLSRILGFAHDIMPYGLVTGNRASLKGLNLVGLQRSNANKSDLQLLRALYAYLFDDKSQQPFNERLASVEQQQGSAVALPQGRAIVDFLRETSKRGITMP